MPVRRLEPGRDGKPRTLVDFYPAGRGAPRVRRVLPMGLAAARIWMRQEIADRPGPGRGGRRKSFAALVEEFLASRRMKNAAPSYMKEIERDLGRRLVARWGACFADRVTTDMVEAYLAEVIAGGAKAGTVRKARAELFTLFRWAARRRRVPFNPVEAIEPPRLPRMEAAWLAPGEFAALWRESPGYLRPLLVPAVTLGLRSREVCMLPRSAVGKGILRVFGKGRKERVLPCPPGLRRLLLSQPRREDGLVFTRPADIYHGRRPESDRWTGDSFYRAVRSAGRRAGLSGVITPHSLRHTAASWMVAAGIPLRRVQWALGHASYATTERYEHSRLMDWRKEARSLPTEMTTFCLHVHRAVGGNGALYRGIGPVEAGTQVTRIVRAAGNRRDIK